MVTPVPSRKIEAESQGSGPVTSYTMSPEEIAAQYGPPKRKEEKQVPPTISMTKDEYIAERASGKRRSDIVNELGLPHASYLTPQLHKWGINKIEDELRLIKQYNESQKSAPIEPQPEFATKLSDSVGNAAEAKVSSPAPKAGLVKSPVTNVDLFDDELPSFAWAEVTRLESMVRINKSGIRIAGAIESLFEGVERVNVGFASGYLGIRATDEVSDRTSWQLRKYDKGVGLIIPGLTISKIAARNGFAPGTTLVALWHPEQKTLVCKL